MVEDGFSSADPSLAVGPQGPAVVGGVGPIIGSGGGGGSSVPRVSIDGDTVMIDGRGFSVAPSLQEGFIRNRTGGRGSSAQAAIQQAQAIEAARQEQQRAANLQAQKETARQSQLKKIVRDEAIRQKGLKDAGQSTSILDIPIPTILKPTSTWETSMC